MRKVVLGRTGFKVSRLCIGTDYADIYRKLSGYKGSSQIEPIKP